jgi:hypothetical protein
MMNLLQPACDWSRLNLRPRGAFDFELYCPACSEGTLFVNVDPAVLADPYTEDFYGIRSFQCDCPLSDELIGAIEGECARRAGVPRALTRATS